MLSILIPTHNYNVFPLAKRVSDQCKAAGITHEIVVLDDASGGFKADNEQINSLPDASFSILPANIGRSKIRNLLTTKAKYDWLLFLDADTFPVHDDFISKYIDQTTKGDAAINGGILYQPEPPEKDRLFRWTYGRLREAQPVGKRKANPYPAFLSLNFMITKRLFDQSRFDETLPNLRHEDTVFSSDLKKNDIPVRHIENPVFHFGIDTFEVALRKEQDSLVALVYLLDKKRLPETYIRISQLYALLKKTGANQLVKATFNWYKNRLVANLKSENPKMWVFDLYRIGYLCSL